LLEGGCTPIHYDERRGRNVIVRGIAARVFPGVRLLDWGTVDAMDWLRYQCDLALQQFEDYKLAQDGETNLDSKTTTPQGVLDVIHGVYFGPTMVGVLRNQEALWESAEAEINASFTGRVDWTVDVAAMDILSILSGKLRQRSGVI
jgi:hypothetical protein